VRLQQRASDPTSDLQELLQHTQGGLASINRSGEPEQTEADRRYLDLMGQLLDAEGLRKIPPPTQLVEGWLFQNTLAWIQGKWGNGKSFLAIDLACCVATGTPWHGHDVAQGKVLYLIAEGASGLSQRVDAWEAANGCEATNIVFLPVPVQMADPNGVDIAAFRILLANVQPVLVIIDTQARVTVGAEENSSKDMGVFVDALETLRRESGTTMLVVHHEPRNGENLRGSVALEGAAESILRASKDGDSITVSNLKQKNAPEQDAITLTLYPIGESAALFDDVPGNPETLGPNEEKFLEALAEFPGARAVSTQLLEASGIPKGSFYRSRNKLLKKGRILESEEGRSTIYRIPTQYIPKAETQ
jgi:RecA-family ATPase